MDVQGAPPWERTWPRQLFAAALELARELPD